MVSDMFPMFELENLTSFGLDVDFSKIISKNSEKDLEIEFLNKLNLGMLKTPTFNELSIALDEINKLIPELEYTKSVGRHHIRLGLFEKKRLRLVITREGFGESIVKAEFPKGMQQQAPKTFDKAELQKIDKDFNFLLGHLFGILKPPEMPNIKVHIVFVRNGQFVSNGKLEKVCQNVAEIFSNPKAVITGFEIDYFDSSLKKHSLSLSQTDKLFRYRDDFDTKLEGSVNILNIFENSVKLANEICEKICVVPEQ